ncbi:TonB-dependent receptor [Sphingobacterium sp. 1.A.4]|uniref:TonB-dependent receptor n=1 Tax=Sphingobacterium sp. 1.A.4 TaxID=2044603 RepID=UPI000C0BE2CE|nr:TonB-dependent receptor [Sphingobacterium sp. 1.A.4]
MLRILFLCMMLGPWTVILAQQHETIEEVKVSAKRHEQGTAVRQNLSQEEIDESKGKTLAERFSNLSGVSLLSSGHSILKPVINGLHSNRILMLNQGVKHEGQQWGMEHAPEIDPFSADDFELIKGAQAVRYGADALAGVLISKSRSIKTDSLHGAMDLLGFSNGRGFSGNVLLEGGLKSIPNLGWKAQLSGKKLGNSKTADYYLGNTAVQELNFSGQVQYKLANHAFDAYYSRFQTELGVFYGAHVGNIDDILARIAHGEPLEHYDFSYDIQAPKQNVSHQLARLNYQYSFDNDLKLEAQYGWQRNHRKEFDRRRAVADDVPMADMVLDSHSLELLLKKKGYTIGMQAVNQVNNNTPGTGTTPIIPNFESWSIGLFGMHQQVWDRFLLELGWRYDFRYFDAAGYRYRYNDPNESIPQQYLLTDQRNFHNFSGSVGGKYQLDSKWAIRSNVGLAWRAPTANELYADGVHHGAGIYEIGDLDLKAEQGLKWVNSISREADDFAFQLDGYAQYIANYIYSTPNPDSVRQTIRGTFPVFSYTQHNALFFGLDLNAKWAFLEHWQYQINAGLVRAKNLSMDRYLPYIPSDQFTQSLAWSYAPQDKGYVKLSHQFVAKQNRYEAGTDFMAPPPAYHLMHIHVSQAFRLGRETNQLVNLGLRVENIFNNQYKDYMDRFRYYAHRPGRNFILSINYTF